MEPIEKNNIYDRLLEISLKIDFKNIPDPRYINEKIGQCHVFIEEVEKLYIKISKEMSIIQRSLNNSLAAYENARDNLISTDEEIKSLPSHKDRESRANMSLKKELNEIRGYKNELVDFENLQKALNLKLKNLSRLNTDIKTQLKLMDSQIRLGTPQADSPAARSLIEELNKSTVGVDIFNNMETTSEENNIVDPSEPLNIDELLSTTEEKSDENIINDALIPDILTTESEERTVIERLLDPMPTDPEDDISACMPGENASEESEPVESVIDLDKILIPETLKFGGESKIIVEPKKQEPIQKEVQKTKSADSIDIDSLLSQFK